MRLVRRHSRSSVILLLLAGCSGMLPPPPPPKLRTAPAVNPQATSTPGPKKPEPPPAPHDGKHYQVKFETTKGDFVVDVHPDWAPRGAERFQQLVREGYYDGCKFFRVKPNFVVQWGINGDPAVSKKYQENKIPDDKRTHSNTRGTIVFATSGPNSRTTQLFVNLRDNSESLDPQNFAPFGHVVQGMDDVIDKITSEYGEEPNQQLIASAGNIYLDERFPNLDYIIKATIVGEESPEQKTEAAPAEKKEAPAKPNDDDEKPAEKDKPDSEPENQ